MEEPMKNDGSVEKYVELFHLDATQYFPLKNLNLQEVIFRIPYCKI